MTDDPKGPEPRIVGLAEANDPAFGGKARGLARLIGMGLPVPAGFVIVDAAPGRLPRGLADRYRKLGGGKVAVRSSAQGEDSASASFAGQYETLLDVEGEAALALAVERCLASIDSERARVYADARDLPGETARRARRMCVIVQRMVDARCAGVLFTVDPMTGRSLAAA